ncbi:N-acetyltransferase [Oerskovia turbata]|uniref:N-acetyltransferase n=1 Tax=Oerskovia turbata TaxID=1713 RepID=A0A4Q1L0L0_9CELL|nr:GNAT family N-acetyltransferase [Oerskovia turbata]RXR27932.1 N-acetyltransferase [Oerskovia turbata]RXR35630.1 N-acetyltransferase [Oerskovia turbata]TGJ96608.1 N-acetyltransferase [Actinotalea fermentans ATCC 43279 = JCM 9966 = DSM 3133]
MLISRPFDKLIVQHSEFDCGEPVLDDWLKNYASQNEKRDATRTFLLLDEKESCVAGYATTVTHRLDPHEASAALGRVRRYPLPAVLVARLAVDRRYQGSGVGRLLLIDTLQRLERASHDIGFELVVVDALHEDAACFYLKHGFQRFQSHPLRLFMATRTLRATFADPD